MTTKTDPWLESLQAQLPPGWEIRVVLHGMIHLSLVYLAQMGWLVELEKPGHPPVRGRGITRDEAASDALQKLSSLI